jgi:hypothetical protein
MQRTGNAGLYHASPQRDGHTAGKAEAQKKRREAKLADLVEEYEVVTIEAGAAGGYVVTLDDQWTGGEHRSIPAALKAAEKVAEDDGE